MLNDFIITAIDRVVMIGKEEFSGDKISFSGNIKSNELIFTFSGHNTVYFGDYIVEDKANCIRFLPKGNHSRYDVFRHENSECIDVYFQTDRPVSTHALEITPFKKEKVRSLFTKIFTCWAGKEEGYYFECISLLYKIFSELQQKNFVSKKHYERIKPAIDVIHEDFLVRNFSIKELGELCGIGESYFKRLFKEKYGISPKKYIIQLKLNHACELLRLERYSVSKIAELCNFNDIYFFSRQFKEHIGLTPTKFAKKYRSSK